MFAKVLVANRGEIACRLLETLRRLGVPSVAVYSEADRYARHVLAADEAIAIGPASSSQSYLAAEVLVRAAVDCGAEAVHPGYGFLSENAGFAQQLQDAGVTFIGPTPEQMMRFGRKHEARALAEASGLALLPGTGLLADVGEALEASNRIGFPLMLKSTAGGGGIGMQLCRDRAELAQKFDTVRGLAQKNFADGGVFLERYVQRARHLEVQIFGDGFGRVVALGERDCSAQRRHQKVIEETPAPRLKSETRVAMHRAAVELGQSVCYRSAGTVEFVCDDDTGEFYFLEVNTRLQVEHGVTELVYGIDLVEWMLRLASGESFGFEPPAPRGHAMEVRVYAEDPARDFRPCAGTLTEVVFPSEVRTDTWVELGTEVSSFYDPMLAKIIVWGATRNEAVDALTSALERTRLGGIETNLEYLLELSRDAALRNGSITTAYLGTLRLASRTVEVLSPGTLTTIQDYPGRVGYWDVGIPPSGPMDDLGFRLANRVVGNLEGAPGLEFTVDGPSLQFAADAVVALGGADFDSWLDGVPIERYRPVTVRPGQILRVGACRGPGYRAYLAVRHGFDVPRYLGSCATFTLGNFGGHGGRALRKGDVIRVANQGNVDAEPCALAAEAIPRVESYREIGVLYGPHGAPDFFKPNDIERLFSTDWQIHYNSARTGVRLIGPKPEWARADGGEAGLHPSNLHDNAYALGAIDFTGDMPILLGPDGPSLGGFVCPATVVEAERWKLGQLKPGELVRFVPITLEAARALKAAQDALVEERRPATILPLLATTVSSAVIKQLRDNGPRPLVTYRPAGDTYLLIEYGPMILDLTLRVRVHLLMQRLMSERRPGVLELTPGIRSLQIRYDPSKLPLATLLSWLERIEEELPSANEVTLPTRIVHLPLSWDDPATQLAIEKYKQGVRREAPWIPSNLEFIRRINGLESIADVKRIVFEASYLVLGLGDVYLGAPVATPLDPRHRLVTTKYNPARTWTPENAVGIGGAYLCVYGMEGPGGYQFVGRTIQMYNRHKVTRQFREGQPWLLRFFDQIRFYPVSAQELLEMRAAFPHGKLELTMTEEPLRFADYARRLRDDQLSIAEFKQAQQTAFEAERQRWQEGAEDTQPRVDPSHFNAIVSELAEGVEGVESHVQGSVWKIHVRAGDRVTQGDPLIVLESMKMEISIDAPCDGRVCEVIASEGQSISRGQLLVTMDRNSVPSLNGSATQ